MQNQLEARYDIDTLDAPAERTGRFTKASSWRWAAFLLLLLAAILLLAGLNNDIHANIDFDGGLAGGLIAVTFGTIAVVFALLTFVLIMVGVSLLVVLLVVAVLGVVFLALTPVWLPVLLAIALLVWLVRKL